MYYKNSKSISRFFMHLFLIIVAISVLVPIIYIVLVSFGDMNTVESGILIPNKLTLQNYSDLFYNFSFGEWIRNSLILAVGTMITAVLLTSFSSYAFSRLRFKGRNRLFSTVMLIQVFPLTLSMVSIFKILDTFRLLDSLMGLMLVDSIMASAGLVLLAKGYFDTISMDIDESARIDGAGHFKIFVKIILPLVKPMLVIIAIQSFVLAYNEYVLANVVITGGSEKMPLALGLQTMIEGQVTTNWPMYCAGATLGSIPVVAIFYLLQKYSITGLTEGAVK
jgi:ABC-type maltose transport systems, permease component